MPNYNVQPGETKKEYRERLAREQAAELAVEKDKMTTGEIPFVMDVDDFGFLLPGHDDLFRLKKSLPGFKITCFTIPLDKAFYGANSKHYKLESYKKWAKMVNELGWIEVAIHGFSHVHFECDCSYDKAMTMLEAVENMFATVGLNYVKLIKAPYWQMSYDFLVACRDRGYTVAIDRNYPRPIPEGLKTYVYNWSFEEPLPQKQVIKGHGHFVGPNKNNIYDTLHNILKQVPRTARFLTVSEYLKQYGADTKELEKRYPSGQLGQGFEAGTQEGQGSESAEGAHSLDEAGDSAFPGPQS